MAGPDKIMLIRHAKKPNGSPPAGVTEDGLEDKHSLIVRGWQRAGALVAFFPKPTLAGIATPTAVFASGVSDQVDRRCRTTRRACVLVALATQTYPARCHRLLCERSGVGRSL
jgi:hypothetical protein